MTISHLVRCGSPQPRQPAFPFTPWSLLLTKNRLHEELTKLWFFNMNQIMSFLCKTPQWLPTGLRREVIALSMASGPPSPAPCSFPPCWRLQWLFPPSTLLPGPACLASLGNHRTFALEQSSQRHLGVWLSLASVFCSEASFSVRLT